MYTPNHTPISHQAFYTIFSKTETCQCKNPIVGSFNYKGIITNLELYQDSWQYDIEAYTFYINNFNQQNGFFPVTSVQVNNCIEWLTECLECQKKLSHQLTGSNLA